MELEIDNQRDEIENNTSAYFSVSPFKLALMSICTVGVYNLYWFYKNWIHIKNQLGLDISPAWRTIFAPLWVYNLFDLIQDNLNP